MVCAFGDYRIEAANLVDDKRQAVVINKLGVSEDARHLTKVLFDGLPVGLYLFYKLILGIQKSQAVMVSFADKFAAWINAVNGCGNVVNLFMDYETFGEHQWEDTGIFNFLKHLPQAILRHPDNNFKTPSEVIRSYPPVDTIDVPYTISWADLERDLSAWKGNSMQENALAELYRLEDKVKNTENPGIIDIWRRLQTSDHFYYMCTKWFSDGDVHKYFNHYNSPYDAYINYMNVLDNLDSNCSEAILKKPQPQPQRQPQRVYELSA